MPLTHAHRLPRPLGVTAALLIALTALTALTGAAAVTGSAPAPLDTLTVPKAAVLGIVEGVTEYLPISSTGHLLITQRILDVGQGSDKDAADTYLVVIQIGAILAVLGLYRRRFALMIDGVTRGSREGRSLLASLVVAFIPAAVIGFVGEKLIKDRLLQPWPVVAAWIVGGLVIFAFVANQHRLKVRTTSVTAIDWKMALGIGAAQVVAMWPGTSRSLITILAALALGASLEVAVEFSFLLGFVTLSAATAFELVKNGGTLIDTFGWVNPLVGIVAAGVSAWLSVRWMVNYLQRHPLTIFGWYRIVAGVVVGSLLLAGVL